MQYIRNDSLDPHYNLALEEYVLKNLDQHDSYILLWQNEPSVIIGRYQNTIEEINQDYIRENNINVVRRITGGGAVYHDLGNLNFSFIVNNNDSDMDFKRFTEPVIRALSKMGIKVEQSGRNDITIDNKKFSGNAQYHFRGRTLHHGTILYSANLNNVQAALNVKQEKVESKGVKSVRSRVTNIIDYLEQKTSVHEFKDLLLYHMFEGNQISEYTLSEEDLDQIRQLMENKYQTWDWNYGHSPAFNITKSGRFECGGIEFRFYIEKGLIKECTIYGDFFSNEDIDRLAEQFQGVKYESKDLAAFIDKINLTKYFGKITKEELLECIL